MTYKYDAHLELIVRYLYDIDQKLRHIIGMEMDKKIKTAKKSIDKKMDALVKEDKKRDKACDMNEKMMKKKK